MSRSTSCASQRVVGDKIRKREDCTKNACPPVDNLRQKPEQCDNVVLTNRHKFKMGKPTPEQKENIRIVENRAKTPGQCDNTVVLNQNKFKGRVGIPTKL